MLAEGRRLQSMSPRGIPSARSLLTDPVVVADLREAGLSLHHLHTLARCFSCALLAHNDNLPPPVGR
jgi:hypothetical protein